MEARARCLQRTGQSWIIFPTLASASRVTQVSPAPVFRIELFRRHCRSRRRRLLATPDLKVAAGASRLVSHRLSVVIRAVHSKRHQSRGSCIQVRNPGLGKNDVFVVRATAPQIGHACAGGWDPSTVAPSGQPMVIGSERVLPVRHIFLRLIVHKRCRVISRLDGLRRWCDWLIACRGRR